MKRFPLLFILAGMAIAVLLAVGYIGVVLQPPAQDVQLLVLFMTGSGLLTVVLAYVLYRRGLVRWLPSLRWTLLTIVLITVLLILLNVWFTAQLMFISEHDLVLTVALLLFAGLTAFTFGLFVASTLIDRIGALSSAVDGLAEGRLDTRLDVTGTDELAQLGDDLQRDGRQPAKGGGPKAPRGADAPAVDRRGLPRSAHAADLRPRDAGSDGR
jgi:hypothetical protein